MSGAAAAEPTRGRFEALLRALGYYPSAFDRAANGEYAVPVVQQAWELWVTNNGLMAIGA